MSSSLLTLSSFSANTAQRVCSVETSTVQAQVIVALCKLKVTDCNFNTTPERWQNMFFYIISFGLFYRYHQVKWLQEEPIFKCEIHSFLQLIMRQFKCDLTNGNQSHDDSATCNPLTLSETLNSVLFLPNKALNQCLTLTVMHDFVQSNQSLSFWFEKALPIHPYCFMTTLEVNRPIDASKFCNRGVISVIQLLWKSP